MHSVTSSPCISPYNFCRLEKEASLHGCFTQRTTDSDSQFGEHLTRMTGASNKRQKREAYRTAQGVDNGELQLPKKKFYRQRAHANPFSDHQLS